jgi:dTDP-4-dehydrorhamnose reductase
VRILVTGAAGMLGRDLAQDLGVAGATISTATRADLDLTDADACAKAVEQHDVVVNAAAWTAVDDAETQEAAAFAVNGTGAANLARACDQAGARLVHVSTDYVFDGTASQPYIEDDRPNPLSAYGASKLAGETMVAAAGGAFLIVRTSAVLGVGGSQAKGGSFVERILARARSGGPLRVVADQVFSPTYAPDLAMALLALVQKGARGLYHVTNDGTCSWHELAEASVRAAGLDLPVEKIRAQDLNQPARRPAYSVLSNARYRALGLAPLRPWREMLPELLANAR